jgi:hypothetical protein
MDSMSILHNAAYLLSPSFSSERFEDFHPDGFQLSVDDVTDGFMEFSEHDLPESSSLTPEGKRVRKRGDSQFNSPNYNPPDSTERGHSSNTQESFV